MNSMARARRICCSLLWLGCLGIATAQQPTGTIFYNQYDFSSGQPLLRLASMRPDGTAPTLLPVALPEPGYPAVSADGLRVAVTAADPKKLFTVSQDVFVLNLATGQLLQLTSFSNFFSNPTMGTAGQIRWDEAKFTAPYFKAFSPDGSHLALSAYEVNGTFVKDDRLAFNGNYRTEHWTGTTTTPTLRVYAFDSSPPVLVAAGTGADIHGGDGIDWSPDGTLLAWPNTIDVI